MRDGERAGGGGKAGGVERPALTPRPRARGADPWGQCGLPRAGRLGSGQGASCEVPGARPRPVAGTEEHVDGAPTGKGGRTAGATAQDPTPLLEPAVTPRRTPASPEGTWGHCRRTCPKGTGRTSGAWGLVTRLPGGILPAPQNPISTENG